MLKTRMKNAIVLALILFAVSVNAQPLPDQFAASGKLIFIEFNSSPFPHPARYEGHWYKTNFFPAPKHYADRHVALFVPKGFRVGSTIDFVVHFHGWGANVPVALEKYKIIDQFVASGRNAILVVPQGPLEASDSFGGKLEDPNGFKRFMNEVMETLKANGVFRSARIGNIILSGHSGGYAVISSILEVGGLTRQVKEVWLFDALYGRTSKFVAWFNAQNGRFLNIYTANGGTKKETETLIADFKKAGVLFCSKNERELLTEDLNRNWPVFIFTDMAHDNVMHQRRTLCQFLQTSCLKPIQTKTFVSSPRASQL